MASTKKRASKKKTDPPETETRGRKPIDVEPTTRAPPSLLDRIAAFHACIYWVGLCTGGERTQQIAGREWSFASSPPEFSPTEIGDKVIEWCEAESSGPGSRFKLWMRGRSDPQDPKTERSRWATLRMVTRGDGSLQVIDDPEAEEASQHRGAFRETMLAIETASRVVVDQMERIGKVTQNFVSVSDSVAKLMEAHAASVKADHEGEYRMAQLLADVHANEQQMQYRHERLQRMAAFFEPSSERVSSFVEKVLDDLYEKTKHQPRDTTVTKASALESFVAAMSTDEQAAMSDIFTADEHSMIASMRSAPSDSEFDAIAEKLADSLRPRKSKVESQIVSALGVERALKLRDLLT